MPAYCNFGAETFTYGDVAAGIEKYHILFKECGIKKDDKIAICARNSAQWGIAFMAVVTYDAVVVPLLPDFLPKSVVELTCFSDCRMLIVDDSINRGLQRDDVLKAYEEQHDFLGVYNLMTMKPIVSYSDVFTEVSDQLDAKFNAKYPNGVKADDVDYSKSNDDMDRLALISFTSGTSSSPKGVMLSVRSLSSNMRFALSAIPTHVGGHILSILPLAHMFGMTFDFLYPMTIGGKITMLTQKPTPVRLLAALAEVKPFMFLTVPMVIEKVFKSKVIPTLRKPMMRVALAIPGLNRIILKAVRDKLYNTFGGNLLHGIIIGGAALNKDVEKWMKKMKFPYCVGYGMTECGPIISYCAWENFEFSSCGRLVRPLELRIDSTNPEKILGEIQVKGDNVMMGYYKNEEATRAAFTKDGWLRTGDMGTFDKKDNVFIKGRCKNMILSASGQNIYPEEIEDKLNNIPYVVETLAVGRKNAIIGLIVPNWDAAKAAGLSEEQLAELIREEVKKINVDLPAYSKVNDIELRRDAFEKTPKQSIKRFMYQ
jgi:long-chain acyl-CoA synthetase